MNKHIQAARMSSLKCKNPPSHAKSTQNDVMHKELDFQDYFIDQGPEFCLHSLLTVAFSHYVSEGTPAFFVGRAV